MSSSFTQVAEGLRKLYAEYEIVDENDFVDFYLHVKHPGVLRRFFKPQVTFTHDGYSPFKPLPAEHAFALFEWAFNWCVGNYAHNFLLIHAAIVEKNGNALVLPAPPGSGKSTLCASLVAHGWRLLSDELTIIEPRTGAAIPFPRPVSLKNASIDIISTTFPQMIIGPKSYDTSKGTVAHMKASSHSIANGNLAAAPRWVVFPKYLSESKTELALISKGEAFIELINNSFNYDLLGKNGFDAMVALINKTDTFSFRYSSIPEALALFDKMAESALQ